jgi:hypothetical protein
VDVDPPSNSNSYYPDDSLVVTTLPFLDATFRVLPYGSQSRSMSRSSDDDGAGSDRSDLSYMSLPGTPTADGKLSDCY